ncbi:MAG: hypothetical protein Q4F57_04740 [Weeksellaceae bacterium]|nr:hypothetical protein [Weeksellaceae bacterium]
MDKPIQIRQFPYNFGAVGQHLLYVGAASVSAKLQGGNFWQYAVQALTVGLLNHGVQRIEYIYQKKRVSVINSLQAIDLYLTPNNGQVELGWGIKRKLLGSDESKYVVHRLEKGIAVKLSAKITVDLTKDIDTFFVGQTTLEYFTTCTISICVTKFVAFGSDGFRDPLDIGQTISKVLKKDINVELPKGNPYDFIPWDYKIQYKNPGYAPR